MRLAKAFGLAVVAALAMAAFGGAGTASATVLCKEKPEKVAGVDKCPEAQVYGEGEQTKVKTTLKPGTESEFKEQAGENQATLFTCQNAELGGSITQAQQVEGQLEAGQVSFTGKPADPQSEFCEHVATGEQVKVTVENLPYNVSATYEGQQLSQDETEEVGFGKVHAEGKEVEGVIQPIKFSFETQGFPAVTCEYEAKAEPVQGKAINGSVESQVSQVIFDGTQAGFEEIGNEPLCEDEGKFVATLNIKGEQAEEQIDLYIAKEKA